LWTSTSLTMQSLKTLTLPWSDHKAFLFTLQLK
jgi:hypothetical protein